MTLITPESEGLSLLSSCATLIPSMFTRAQRGRSKAAVRIFSGRGVYAYWVRIMPVVMSPDVQQHKFSILLCSSQDRLFSVNPSVRRSVHTIEPVSPLTRSRRLFRVDKKQDRILPFGQRALCKSLANSQTGDDSIFCDGLVQFQFRISERPNRSNRIPHTLFGERSARLLQPSVCLAGVGSPRSHANRSFDAEIPMGACATPTHLRPLFLIVYQNLGTHYN